MVENIIPEEASPRTSSWGRHPLPLGSTLKNGVFHWQPGIGYLGQYELAFEQAGGGAVGVLVTITPKTFSPSLE